MSETETRAVRDVHDALAWRGRAESAEAEAARLRGVVEAVQALADEWEVYDGDAPSLIDAAFITCADALRAALAPALSSGEGIEALIERSSLGTPGAKRLRASVSDEQVAAVLARSEEIHSSSGEAESGAGQGNASSVFPMRDPYRSTTPAPVPSGGQADGESVRLRPDEIERLDFNYQVGDGRWLFTEVECIIAARLAARPVLSREALRERMRGHWPASSERGGIDCECGKGGSVRGYIDHLADVLAGGEQDG